MPSLFLTATATDCFDLARMFLNDHGVSPQLWTDTVLMPMMKEAHLELQQKLKQRASPSLRAYETLTVPALAIELPVIQDMVTPIRLWEKPQGSPPTSFQIMTETDMLPLQFPARTLTWWMWDQDFVLFVGATIGIDVFVDYWRRIPIPTAGGDLIGMIDGELYLAPRIAALAMGSVGEEATSSVANALADSSLQIVMASNKTRMTQNPDSSPKP